MANNDSELKEEVRAITNYGARAVSSSDLQSLINIGKDEIVMMLPGGNDGFVGFYSGNLAADRALFWFTTIAAKVHTGEIEGVDISVDSFLDFDGGSASDSMLFDRFERAIATARGESSGIGHIQVQRDNRSYGENL